MHVAQSLAIVLSQTQWLSLKKSNTLTSGLHRVAPWHPLDNLFIDDLLGRLHAVGSLGIIQLFLRAQAYADNLLRIAHSQAALSLLIAICRAHSQEWLCKANKEKSHVIVYEPFAGESASVCMWGTQPLAVAVQEPYLGL